MKTIIAGSRNITNYDLVESIIIESGFDITKVISGMAKGVDSFGELWAHYNNIGCHLCPAKWKREDGTVDRSAGYKRNVEMAEIADALIVIILDDSKGSTHMLNIAKEKGLKIFEKRFYTKN
jgi:hypothetical protein